jgi:SlyX protein
MSDEISDRIQKLEMHVAHLEHQIDQLDRVIIEQGHVIERLKKEAQRQAGTLEGMELDRIRANNSKPPHYQ